MNIELKKKIKEMPKTMLHIHLDGSLRPETVYKWLKEERKDVGLEDVKNALMVSRDCRNLNEYLQKFDLPLKVLQTKEHIEQATYELFEDLSNQNVIYAEVRFAPSLHTKNGLDYDGIVEAAIRGMNEAKYKYGIEGGLILCCMRGNDNKEANFETVRVANDYLNKGVCAIDLAGAEALFPTSSFEDIFKKAKELNIPFTIHAGEAAGPESIKKALEYGAVRIGHGIRCMEDTGVAAELLQKGITLEICPTSNLQTKAVEGKYPLEEIYRKGIPATINTDNDTVSNTNILEEYEWVLENTKLSIKDLENMNLNAIRGAFTTPQKKAGLVHKILSFSKEKDKDIDKQ